MEMESSGPQAEPGCARPALSPDPRDAHTLNHSRTDRPIPSPLAFVCFVEQTEIWDSRNAHSYNFENFLCGDSRLASSTSVRLACAHERIQRDAVALRTVSGLTFDVALDDFRPFDLESRKHVHEVLGRWQQFRMLRSADAVLDVAAIVPDVEYQTAG